MSHTKGTGCSSGGGFISSPAPQPAPGARGRRPSNRCRCDVVAAVVAAAAAAPFSCGGAAGRRGRPRCGGGACSGRSHRLLGLAATRVSGGASAGLPRVVRLRPALRAALLLARRRRAQADSLAGARE